MSDSGSLGKSNGLIVVTDVDFLWRKRNEGGENPEPANANGRDVIGQAFAF